MASRTGYCQTSAPKSEVHSISWRPIAIADTYHWLDMVTLGKSLESGGKLYSLRQYLKQGQCLRLGEEESRSPQAQSVLLHNDSSEERVVFLYSTFLKRPLFVALASPNSTVKCLIDFNEGYLTSSPFLKKTASVIPFLSSNRRFKFGKSIEGTVVISPSKGEAMSSWLRIGLKERTLKTLLTTTRIPNENIAVHSYFPSTLLIPAGGTSLKLPAGRYLLTLGSGLQSCFKEIVVKESETTQVENCNWKNEERYKVIANLSQENLNQSQFLKWLESSAYLFPFSMETLRAQKCCKNYNVKFLSKVRKEPLQFFISYPKTPKFQVQEFTQIWDSIGLYTPRPWYRGDSFYREAISGFERFIRFLSVASEEDIKRGYNIFMGLNTFYFNKLSSDFEVPSFNNGGAIVLESPKYKENSQLLSVNRNNTFEVKINHFSWWVPEVLTTYVNGKVWLKTKIKPTQKKYFIKISKRSDFKVSFSVTGRKVLPEAIYGVEGLLPFAGTEIFCVDLDENGRCELQKFN